MKCRTFLVAVGLLVGINNAYATALPCDVSDIQLNFVQRLDGVDPGTTVNPPFNASDCVGAFQGNNSLFANPTMGNLGYDNDGWFNKESNFWPGLPAAFTESSELQDLDGDGQVNDPGWVYLGKDDGQGFKGATSTDGVTSYQFIDDLLVLSNCKDKDGDSTACVGGDAIMGEWSWNPPTMNPQDLLDLLGGMFFDQVAVIFKSANYFSIYNFNIGDLGIDPVLAEDFNFKFAGTWDTSNTLKNRGGNPAGLSNISLWARDPVIDIPAPSSLGLLIISLALLIRRKTN
ncbi:hypothetical protein H0A36_12640 [Endozoicomonas sp. SM1973]|uniref:PEP-CTERM protein-sorting domain-containing protein n=1 Tax=Spartinivicinus marinus TaxID=2994442 RepID=A0A853IAJ4_9GAMM|nr:hypothetical protein [Spartinivicinus marinus]MCX4026489.1 hypothetical protein [Spartinivicinus marinus]NYZ66861.1 hypothetical protein [Spartinivicinus marinus]